MIPRSFGCTAARAGRSGPPPDPTARSRPELRLLEADAPPADPAERAEWAYRSWGERLVVFLFRMVGDRHEAEALAQEVLCRFLQEQGDFRTAAAVRGRLFRVARNLSIDWHKKRRPRPFGDQPDPLPDLGESAGRDAEEREPPDPWILPARKESRPHRWSIAVSTQSGPAHDLSWPAVIVAAR